MIFIHYKLTPNEQIKAAEFLEKVKSLLATGQYTICENSKNIDFNRTYNLLDAEKVNIIKSLTVDDCVKIEQNNNPLYKTAEVYVFLKTEIINVYGENENVTLYIKMYIDDDDYCDMIIVISFHKEGVYE